MSLPLLPGETIILTRRRHWFVLAIQMVGLALAKIVLLGAFFLFWMFDLVGIPFELFLLLLVIALQSLWIAAFYFLTDYILDIWLITNKRSVRIKLHGLFNRSVLSIMHNRIQDISTQSKGFFPVVFGYGNLRVQAAGAASDFVFFDIPNPEKTKDIIYKAALEYRKRKGEEESIA
ncbi:MAG: PH domain-containing protein [bacterium]|nr:PH domain-containing protein [bacterium]